MLLIDGDILTYRIGFAVEKDKWGMDAARYNIRKSLDDMMVANQDCDYKIYLTGKGNFRFKRATLLPYKGTRDGAKRPKYYQKIRDYFTEVYKAEVIDGMEADDALGIEQMKLKDSVICTIDKDMDMIPGWHYNFVKRKRYFIDDVEADKNFFKQVLLGDTCDNIPGLYGYGKAKVNKIIEENKNNLELKDVVRQEYSKAVKDGKLRLKGTTVEINDNRTVDDVVNEISDLLWIRRA